MADRDISEKTRQFIASGYKLPVDPAATREHRRGVYETVRFILSVIAMSLAITFTYTLMPMLFAVAAVMMVGLFIVDGIGFVLFTVGPSVRRFAEGRNADKTDQDKPDDIPVYVGDTIRSLAWRWLRQRFSWRWVVSTAMTVAFVICLLRNVGVVMMPNDALAPLIHQGELVILSKRITPEALKRGDWIIFRFADDTVVGQAGHPTVGQIVAGPDSEMSIADGQFIVDGEPASPVGVTADRRAVIDVPAAPRTMTVPAERWFVVCEQGGTRMDGRLIGWALQDRIMGADMVIVSLKRFGTRLDEPAGDL